MQEKRVKLAKRQCPSLQQLRRILRKMFISCHLFEDTHKKDLWLMDNGYNNPMTGNKNIISYLDAFITSKITRGDWSCIKSEGKGIVPILTKKNKHKYTHHVYYVPHLKHNFITVGQLM